MTREKKFKAWDEKNKRMSEVFSIDEIQRDDDNEAFNSGCFFMNWKGDKHTFWFDDCELLEFIGLKDRNGKEIFEGDILSCKHPNRGDPNILIVEFSNCNFKALNKERSFGIALGNHLLEKIEVIGNKYENSKLLEEKKK